MECGGEGGAQDSFLALGLGDRDMIMRFSSWGAQKEQVHGGWRRGGASWLGHVGCEILVDMQFLEFRRRLRTWGLCIWESCQLH